MLLCCMSRKLLDYIYFPSSELKGSQPPTAGSPYLELPDGEENVYNSITCCSFHSKKCLWQYSLFMLTHQVVFHWYLQAIQPDRLEVFKITIHHRTNAVISITLVISLKPTNMKRIDILNKSAIRLSNRMRRFSRYCSNRSGVYFLLCLRDCNVPIIGTAQWI